MARRFTAGMDRVARINLLLDCVSGKELVRSLSEYDDEAIRRYVQTLSPLQLSQGSASNPYRGLSASQIADAPLFFGRRALAEALWQRYHAIYQPPTATQTRLLTILGPSGAGKSSLARAGLLAALIERPIPRHALRSLDPRPARPERLEELIARLEASYTEDHFIQLHVLFQFRDGQN